MCVNLLHQLRRKKYKFNQKKRVGVSIWGLPVTASTVFQSSKEIHFSPLILFEDVLELQGVCSSVNPTFPVFMGTGTVSRRRDCRSSAASIESLAAAVQHTFASAAFENVD